MNPVPDFPTIDTPYGRRGPYWSCDQDAQGNGIHTGADFAAPAGTRVVAARPGTLAWTNHGSAFGNHQVEVRCSDGTRDFYAHLRTRATEGWIEAGARIGEVGSEGNATGPHLHFERHATTTGPWSCAVVRDPKPSIDWENDDMNEQDWERMEGLLRAYGWEQQIWVTQPGTGEDVPKAARQLLRELWQKVTRVT